MDTPPKRRRVKKDTAQKSGQSSGRGQRNLKQKVKTAKGRKLSSKLWLERQLNDPYVAAAKQAGYRSRAAFKLIEMDDKYRLLKPGARIVDLGAAPGGWTQVAVERTKSPPDAPLVLAVDILAMEPIPGAREMQLDFLDPAAPDIVTDTLSGQAQMVLSDMAAPATGHRQTDHLRVVALCETAYDFAIQVLAPGGGFLAKVFQGGTESELLLRMKNDFTAIHHVKPQASRDESPEMYVLATGFKGRP